MLGAGRNLMRRYKCEVSVGFGVWWCCFWFGYCARLYFSRSDLANSLKLVRICRWASAGGVLGVGEKLSPLWSSCMSCGVRLYVLKLCIVRSVAWCEGAGLKKTPSGVGGQQGRRELLVMVIVERMWVARRRNGPVWVVLWGFRVGCCVFFFVVYLLLGSLGV